MDYIKKISLDINATSVSSLVKAKQGDRGSRYLNVTLLKDGVKVVPDDSDIVTFRVEKPDGHAVVNTATVEADGTITVELTSQITAVIGKSKADICLYRSDNSISTVTFAIQIIASPDVADQTESSDEFKLLNKLLDDVNKAKEKIEEAIREWEDVESEIHEAAETASLKAEESSEYAVSSKSYAVGETGTREGEDTDNAKYYYSQSKNAEEEAKSSAKSISESADQIKNNTSKIVELEDFMNDIIYDVTIYDGGEARERVGDK